MCDAIPMKPSPDLIDYNFLTWLDTLTKVNFFTQVEHIIRPNSTDFNVQVTYLISNLPHTKKIYLQATPLCFRTPFVAKSVKYTMECVA